MIFMKKITSVLISVKRDCLAYFGAQHENIIVGPASVIFIPIGDRTQEIHARRAFIDKHWSTQVLQNIFVAFSEKRNC